MIASKQSPSGAHSLFFLSKNDLVFITKFVLNSLKWRQILNRDVYFCFFPEGRMLWNKLCCLSAGGVTVPTGTMVFLRLLTFLQQKHAITPTMTSNPTPLPAPIDVRSMVSCVLALWSRLLLPASGLGVVVGVIPPEVDDAEVVV